MTRITEHNVVSELQKAMPGFKADPEDEDLSYMVLADFVRYILAETEVLRWSGWEGEQWAEVKAAFAFLDHAACDRDVDEFMHDLILDCVENLDESRWINQLKNFFPPKLYALWASHFTEKPPAFPGTHRWTGDR
jgi:hypothetical protein